AGVQRPDLAAPSGRPGVALSGGVGGRPKRGAGGLLLPVRLLLAPGPGQLPAELIQIHQIAPVLNKICCRIVDRLHGMGPSVSLIRERYQKSNPKNRTFHEKERLFYS